MIARALCLFTFSILAVVSSTRTSADESWLRGDPENLEIRIHGRIVDSDGRPADDCQITGQIIRYQKRSSIAGTVDQDRFEFWIPVHQFEGTSLMIDVRNRAADEIESKSIEPFQFRTAAMEGLVLKLQKPSRTLEIKVVDQGTPVPNAKVIVETRNSQLFRGSTNELGIATFKLLPTQQLMRLTAWADDHRLGGYAFYRTPPRDATLNEHTISLSPCRDLMLRCVDDADVPVPHFEFELHVGTPSPDYNYLGQFDYSRLKTNEVGEVSYPWFPDWKSHHFYAESHSDDWQVVSANEQIKDKPDSTMVRLKKVKRTERQRISGRLRSKVAPVEGICIKFHSFQGELEGFSEELCTFTDELGNFSANVLPDATYCVHAIDTKWVSNIASLILFDTETSNASAPELELVAGEPVQIRVTSGPERKPIGNASVRFYSPFHYSWVENKAKRNGETGPAWSKTTNDDGIVETFALPGKLNVTASVGGWWTKQFIDVSPGKANAMEINRLIDSKQHVAGMLQLERGASGSVSHADIVVANLGGTTKDQQRLKADGNGNVQFETLACPIGIFASTADRKAAGYVVLHDLNELQSKFVLPLKGTTSYYGKLLDGNDRPLVGCTVSAEANMTIRHPVVDDPSISTSFTVQTLEARTDDQGSYVIENVPLEMVTNLNTQSNPSAASKSRIGSIFLEARDRRPIDVKRIGEPNGQQNKAQPISMEKRLIRELDDSRLMGFPVIVLLTETDPTTSDFVNSKFLDYDTNPDVGRFLQWWVDRDTSKITPDVSDFLESHGWNIPPKGKVLACVLGADGHEKARILVDASDIKSDQVVLDFMKAHLPPKLDALQSWDDAFAEAKESKRAVWVCLSGRYCGPCFKLARWMDRHKKTLERDYVMLKFTDNENTSVADRIARGKAYGIPFYAIFDTQENMVLDSVSPMGNIGFPSAFDGVKHLRKMILATRKTITDSELDQMLSELIVD